MYRDAEESITSNMPQSRGHKLLIYIFVDAYLAGDKSTRHSQTGVLIFINKYTVYWYSKSHSTFESSDFVADFYVMKLDGWFRLYVTSYECLVCQ